MHRFLIVLLMLVTANFAAGCMATRKFARNEVKTASDKLNSRIDVTEGEIKETGDRVDQVDRKVAGVDGRVSDLDARTTQGLNTLKTDVQGVDQKASQAQTAADRASGGLAMLDERFQNRNQFTVAAEKAVQFRFDSAKLEERYTGDLDEVAEILARNPNAILVLEGRTDSVGNSEYNVKLGERRVESVRRYLAVEKGVPVFRIHQISMGAARPVASNDSRDGREKNRAVTMMILVPRTDGAVASSK
jgi:outer membrane protein OmpA-like peptidoglycan-associated protein